MKDRLAHPRLARARNSQVWQEIRTAKKTDRLRGLSLSEEQPVL
jgi:hypothetical protein